MKLVFPTATQQQLFVVFCLLFVCNVLTIFFSDLSASRWVRLIGTLVFFGYYIKKSSPTNPTIFLVLLFFAIKDIFIQYYEAAAGLTGFLLFGILAYAMLIKERLPRIKNIQLSGFIIGISIGLIVANGYTLKVLIALMNNSFGNEVQIVLFLLYGSLMMLLAVFAVSYNNSINSTRSMFFVYLVFALLLSDIASLFAYYFDFTYGFYLDRVSYILAMALVVNHGLNAKIKEEEQEVLDIIQQDSPLETKTVNSESAFAKADKKASLYTFIQQDTKA